jgi:predicted RecB family endonuclease
MKKFGHDFDSLAPRKQYYRKDGSMLAEVDLFLENGVEVMAVEVKTQFNAPAVEYHVKRLQLLRKHDAERLKNKDILAAIAGLNIDRDAQELASQLGMYVIKMVEDDKNITVIEPAGAVGKW